MGCRKNLTSLTPNERQAFVFAILQLAAHWEYDKYVDMHRGALLHGHSGPAFFPWHREYLRRFELELQAIDPSVNVPYWDWTVANLNPAGTESLIWRDDFMGGPGDPANNFAVTTGPFAAWNLRRNAFSIFQFPGGGGLIANRMEQRGYSQFRLVEGPHGSAHVWVGGTVAGIATAPRDPVFWLIHSNVDRLWAEWTVNHRSQADWVQYEPTSGGPQGHNLNDTMWPWNGTTTPFGMLPWTTVPENVRPADRLEHRALNTLYDPIDPECRPFVAPRRVLSFSPREIDFGIVSVEFPEEQTLRVQNVGVDPVTVSFSPSPDPFGVPQPEFSWEATDRVLAAGDVATAVVRCTPPGRGLFRGELVITSDAFGSPHSVRLIATGFDPHDPGRPEDLP
jgi:hypothetical protein